VLKVCVLLASSLLASCAGRPPESVNVAVAANFTEPANEIAAAFQGATGYRAVISYGSTGQLFTQITQDAPFEVFLAADQETPRRALAEGFGATAPTTYAVGKIVLLGPGRDISRGAEILREDEFQKLAIANPVTAPYGAAAVETLRSLGLYEQLQPKFVQGNNIAQTFQFVETGNAELGFVAMSQVTGKEPGSIWIVPEALYSPIRQDALLLNRGADNPAARAFLEFLNTPQALAIIEKYGYGQWP
jgi:molybdate transport system substrate-binding protein